MRRRKLPVDSLRKSAKETQDEVDEHDTGSLAVSSLAGKAEMRIIPGSQPSGFDIGPSR